MNIICLLSVKPCIKTYNFFNNIKLNTNYEVFIVIDDNNYKIDIDNYKEFNENSTDLLNPIYKDIVKIIKINNKICEDNGYKNTVLWIEKNKACSRDKALFFFNKIYTNYNHIWFVEEDVFIPNINTITNIDNKYSNEDLLVQKHNVIYEKVYDTWHWNLINSHIKIDPPYASSYICAIRCSKKMLNCINEYASLYNDLFLDEALFNILAMYYKLNILCIAELENLNCCNEYNLFNINDENNLYHPIRSIDKQYLIRNSIFIPNFINKLIN